MLLLFYDDAATLMVGKFTVEHLSRRQQAPMPTPTRSAWSAACLAAGRSIRIQGGWQFTFIEHS